MGTHSSQPVNCSSQRSQRDGAFERAGGDLLLCDLLLMPTPARSSDNFLHSFKGTPPARRAVPALADCVQDRDALREFVGRREVRRQELRDKAGLLGDSGAAACPRPMGGSPPVGGAAAAPLPPTRRQAVPAATVPQRRARRNGRAVLLTPGSLSPRKITIKGAPAARPRFAAQTLDTDLPRQDPGTYQEDGPLDSGLSCDLHVLIATQVSCGV